MKTQPDVLNAIDQVLGGNYETEMQALLDRVFHDDPADPQVEYLWLGNGRPIDYGERECQVEGCQCRQPDITVEKAEPMWGRYDNAPMRSVIHGREVEWERVQTIGIRMTAFDAFIDGSRDHNRELGVGVGHWIDPGHNPLNDREWLEQRVQEGGM